MTGESPDPKNRPMLQTILQYTLLAVGFGFVIFWHELGHFLAAKWVGIRVEQFAVGFGQAVLAWRKGIGFRVGTTTPEYERRVREHVERDETRLKLKETADPTPEQLNKAAEELKLGETEYRLNWIPLGGYVKMLGQDDLNPNSQVDDPRAYNRKPIGARMFVVSAGVIMNVILAAILFMGLFMYGFKAPPAVVGGVRPWSPAATAYRLVDGKQAPAPLQAGDTILTFDGQTIYDWTKIQLNAALAEPGETVALDVKRVATGATETVYIAPRKEDPAGGMGLALGIEGPRSLEGLPADTKVVENTRDLVSDDYLAVKPGERIVAINGEPVNAPAKAASLEESARAIHQLDEAIQRAGLAGGKPVTLTVADASGQTRERTVTPRLEPAFGSTPLNFAGLIPRATVVEVMRDSPAQGKLMPGDVVTRIVTAGDPRDNPTRDEFVARVKQAGGGAQPVTIAVLRDGKPVQVEVTPTVIKIKGMPATPKVGVELGYDAAHAVVAGVVENSPAAQAGIPAGATVTSVNGRPVQSWYDVHRELSQAQPGQPVGIVATTPNGEVKRELTLTAEQVAQARGVHYFAPLALNELTAVRKSKNPLQAAGWGVMETRDFILQFYLTIRRMLDGSVSPTNLMGPLGIFQAGKAFAFKGTDWLVWFLAMISANLAVVNFLPIPIVDGGLFVFLIAEKIKGRPISPRTQSIAQVVGLALLLGIFLFVTYHDIMRQF